MRTEVERLFAGRSRPVIGVHIRHTDRKVSLDRIATEASRLRKRIPEGMIFLATDNERVQERFRRDFSDVFVIDKVLGNDANSLQHVVLGDPRRQAENALDRHVGVGPATGPWIPDTPRSRWQPR